MGSKHDSATDSKDAQPASSTKPAGAAAASSTNAAGAAQPKTSSGGTARVSFAAAVSDADFEAPVASSSARSGKGPKKVGGKKRRW